ncbi:formylglycine-generating enzyme family protein [Engelhardtia mirabilis]|uniref:Serine/threonine-protein kinase pkn1 n=1 Tax=Engelhardtia mirabilis TaxID=2528011 RepID=A0A518BPS5_9BACT|nr:Serine/threonine-protein kinase pkn1 [Planctomycetes bacterium Pla133]QDV03311.1 Serine/threonine-protein kinase pkn1 [Planctomycetes bacterium Pla86]
MSLAAIVLPLATAFAPQQGAVAPPPGMVFVEGGRVTVGADKDHLEPLIEADQEFAPSFASEFPQHTENVREFFLMPTEVTNEQYAAFVRATGHRVPFHMADQEAVAAAQAAFLEEDGRRRQELKDAGQTVPPAQKFDQQAWWDDNWRDFEWSIPEGKEDHPVVYVDYQDAQAYAKWAGLRLMTEVEFQAAGRGKEETVYPWGDEWDGSKVTSSADRPKSSTLAVGATKSATGAGFYDLLGSVWEWTSSPFTPFDKYKAFTVDVGKGSRSRTVNAAAEWNADFRVAVGGSWGSPAFHCRLTTRRRCDRSQQTAALGFRCAASPGIATDLVQAVVDDLPHALRPDLDLEPVAALSMDRYISDAGTAKVPGYARITGYDYFSVIPVDRILHSNPSSFGVETLEEGPVGVAVLTTSLPILEPALEPGTYLISFREKGKDRRDKGEEDEKAAAQGVASRQDGPSADEAEPAYDIESANLLITDANGVLIHAIPIKDVEYATVDKDYPDGRLLVTAYKAPKRAGEDEVVGDTLGVTLDVSSKNSKKAMRFEFKVKVEKDLIDGTWRKR